VIRGGRRELTLLLDLDGTLTDSREGIVRSLAHALHAQAGRAPDDETLVRWIGAPLAEVFAALLPEPSAACVACAIEHYRERFDRIGWRENQIYAGVPEFLAGLRARGLRSLVVTSKARPFAERIARHFGLAGILDGIHGAELDGTRTSKTELIGYVLASEGLSPGHAVMLGDRHYDVIGARANGVRSLGVTYGYGQRAELEAAGATWVCDDLVEALAVLDAAAD
jgi:phosphoglycolate phosphatase